MGLASPCLSRPGRELDNVAAEPTGFCSFDLCHHRAWVSASISTDTGLFARHHNGTKGSLLDEERPAPQTRVCSGCHQRKFSSRLGENASPPDRRASCTNCRKRPGPTCYARSRNTGRVRNTLDAFLARPPGFWILALGSFILANNGRFPGSTRPTHRS